MIGSTLANCLDRHGHAIPSLCVAKHIQRIQSGIAMALERELETYKNKLPELVGQEGKFVLIHGDTVVDTYSTYEDAVKEGYVKFGVNQAFLVKQIQSIEQVQFVSRFVAQCHTSASK